LARAYGATARRRQYRFITVEVLITALPSSLEGLRIVHLSDLDIGEFMPRAAIRRAVGFCCNFYVRRFEV
jgi:predicted MPP superfamily phosphohydrolase